MVDVVKTLKELDNRTVDAVKWVAAEYKYVVDFKKELDEMEYLLGQKQEHREIRKAFRILRWVGRAERKSFREEEAVLELMERIKPLLPNTLKTQEEDLFTKLKTQERKLVEIASMFRGKLKDELSKIETEEDLLERYKKKKQGKEAIRIKEEMTALIERSKKFVATMIDWIGGTETILKQIKNFDQVLMHMARD